MVSRRTIAVQVWDDEADAVGSNTIDVHVGRLRAKLASAGSAGAHRDGARDGLPDGGGMRSRGGAHWAHAAKVATGATVVVAAVAVVVALVVNLMIIGHLGRDVDTRLSERIADASKQIYRPSTGDEHRPARRRPRRRTGLRLEGRAVGRRGPRGDHRAALCPCDIGVEALPPSPCPAAPSGYARSRHEADGWSPARASPGSDQVRNELLVAEALLGALLLLVTFVGSFVVGLRASAPIEEIRKRQAEFTADASHELRTPLSVIEAEVDLALSRERDARNYQATLRRISSESGRLRSIVEDLLWLARADAIAAITRPRRLSTWPRSEWPVSSASRRWHAPRR